MTRMTTAAVAAALLFIGVQADYKNATNIEWAVDLDCTSCIRAGFDYCIYGSSDGKNPTGSNWNCSYHQANPNIVLPDDGKQSGFVCSSAMADQMTAIVAGCRPALNNPTAECGDYFVDLAEQRFDKRQIKNMAVNNSCTYRIFTDCGYPAAQVIINNPNFHGDFDIAYAAHTGFQRDEDLGSTWNISDATEWRGSLGSAEINGVSDIISVGYTSPRIADTEYQQCKSSSRSLWVTITRTKKSPNPMLESDDFLSETPRQLQGLLTYDVELGFQVVQGGFAKALAALSFALVATLSVFAF